MVAKNEVEVDWVVVELTPVKFCKVVEPNTCKLPLESTRNTEVVAFPAVVGVSRDSSGMLELVEVAAIDSLARGEVVPMPMLPEVNTAA